MTDLKNPEQVIGGIWGEEQGLRLYILKAKDGRKLAIVKEPTMEILAEITLTAWRCERAGNLLGASRQYDVLQAKVEKSRTALKEWKRQIEQVISWGKVFLGEKFDQKMQENLLAICNQALADTEKE